MCYVYKIVFPDSRIYIGITKNLNSRLNQHSRSKQLCGQLIRHFGIQNVIYESIFEGTLAECLEIEELLVDAEWLKNPRCVNMCTGGSAGAAFTGKSHTQSSKDKISNSLKGWLKLLYMALPYSLLAWAGIGLFIKYALQTIDITHFLPLLFIGIAVLALPHLQVFTKVKLKETTI